MKIYVFTLLVVAAVTFARQLPVKDLNKDEVLVDIAYWPVIYGGESVEEHHRERRITCDLLDGTGVGHSACAANCIARNRRGGHCNSKGVCVCRKDKWIG
ncbi:defensin-like [Temnothorax curvispinosus]|uniref:Defensin-like n=1 Tax=Temnothorax curvispinosus TaxID=300111 RepID=A0A6J1R285_9HYME|nr:defensin-like [Temnothorax curvispinosus]